MSSSALGQQASPASNLSPQSEEGWSEESDGQVEADGSRKRRRTTRPLSVSCETCKQRKVKCDRGQPACGWCMKNSQRCEYKERKKPGLRAGYGRELEAKLAEQAAMIGKLYSVGCTRYLGIPKPNDLAVMGEKKAIATSSLPEGIHPQACLKPSILPCEHAHQFFFLYIPFARACH